MRDRQLERERDRERMSKTYMYAEYDAVLSELKLMDGQDPDAKIRTLGQ